MTMAFIGRDPQTSSEPGPARGRRSPRLRFSCPRSRTCSALELAETPSPNRARKADVIEQRLPLDAPSTNQPAIVEVSLDKGTPRRVHSLKRRTSILTEVIYMINHNIATPRNWRIGGSSKPRHAVSLSGRTIAVVNQRIDL